MKNQNKENTGRYDRNKRKTVMAVALLGMYMSVLDGVIISIALPTITSYFDADIALSQWTITGYYVAMTAAMLLFARLSESSGKNRMFLAGMAIFTISSLGCGLAPSLPVLIGFRIIQGLGAAMSVSIVMAIIFELYPFSEHGKAMGLLGSTIALASLSGPVLGGFLLGVFGWHAIFMINVPIGILLVAFGIYSMDLDKPEKSVKEKMDWIGAGTLAVAIASSMLFLGLIAEDTTIGVYVIAALFVCIVSLALFIITERRRSDPLLDLSVFSERMFVVPLLCMALVFTAYMILSVSLPFYLEGVMDFSSLEVGVVFVLVAAILTVGAPFVGRFYDLHPWKYFTGIGLFIGAFGFLAVAYFAQIMDLTLVIGALIIFAIGFTLFQSPINAEIMHGLPIEKSALASGLNSAGRQFAMGLGSSVASIIFAFQLQQEGYTGVVTDAAPSLIADATTVAMIVAALLCFAGVVLQALKRNSGGEKNTAMLKT
ncbi:MFS transporter [Methanolacinia petrolearia]|uniref:MFS transporter n=1 Tax=Methanolacinia petrolearia TaxID=54120 RepID=UPI003BACD1A5